jgi:hypothetical protein
MPTAGLFLLFDVIDALTSHLKEFFAGKRLADVPHLKFNYSVRRDDR